MSRFEQYDGGKGPEDRSDTNKRAQCALWKQVKLDNGINLTPEEAAIAINSAQALFAEVLTETLLPSVNDDISNWISQYYPKMT